MGWIDKVIAAIALLVFGVALLPVIPAVIVLLRNPTKEKVTGAAAWGAIISALVIVWLLGL